MPPYADLEQRRAYARAWERTYKQKRGQAHRAKLRAYVARYLVDHPCVDCGESDPIVLEFDHVRGKKVYNVATMINEKRSLKALIEEIAKCDVRCANCHRRATYSRRVLLMASNVA